MKLISDNKKSKRKLLKMTGLIAPAFLVFSMVPRETEALGGLLSRLWSRFSSGFSSGFGVGFGGGPRGGGGGRGFLGRFFGRGGGGNSSTDGRSPGAPPPNLNLGAFPNTTPQGIPRILKGNIKFD